jgi:1-acyl-sn-glycerol-3-phosphate acyltransferase
VLLYRFLTRLLSPAAWWGRLRVGGLDAVPERGAVLVVPNHDSQWDPVVVGLALRRRRLLRFLTRANLFRVPGLGPILRGAGQIPIERGSGDVRALWAAVEALRDGAAVCIFPEGTLSRGKPVRARSGAGRLAEACPSARVVLCAVSGATDYVRFPRRPSVEVDFFAPAGGQPRPREDPAEVAARLLIEIRERVPPVAAGRRAEPRTTTPAPGEPETDAGR